MRRPGATLSTWWLSTGPTARRGRPAVGSSTASSKHRRRPSNVNCLDRSRFPLAPRLRVDGRRSGCWRRKRSKDVNSKLAWVSPEDFEAAGRRRRRVHQILGIPTAAECPSPNSLLRIGQPTRRRTATSMLRTRIIEEYRELKRRDLKSRPSYFPPNTPAVDDSQSPSRAFAAQSHSCPVWLSFRTD